MSPRASRRLLLAGCAAGLLAWLLPEKLGAAERATLAWDGAAFFLLAWAWAHILRSTPEQTRAFLYYEDATGADANAGGLEFPRKATPCELDFAYFSFTVGMTFQVSDVVVTSTPMRHTVLGKAVLAFAYNTAVVAFCLQLIFGAL